MIVRTGMNRGITRRQLLAALVAAGAIPLKAAARFLTAQSGERGRPPLPRRTPPPRPVYDRIRKEAVAPDSETNHALPLVSSWNASTWWNYNADTAGFSPVWQLGQMKQGHYLLPWFEIPTPEMSGESPSWGYYWEYFKTPIKRAARLGLPVSFKGTQWEHYLYDDPAYLGLPPGQNPNVVSQDGTILKKLSPFGPKDCWYDVGLNWGASPLLRQLIDWYPAPPLVLFVSNNEAVKLSWVEAETDQHYLDRYGQGRDGNFKRQVFGEGWSERYRALIQGFRDGLASREWQDCSKFIGYAAFGLGAFGRWDGWKKYSLYIPRRVDPNPLFWEGGSPALYIWAEHGERDNNVAGPLFQAMNWVFMLNEARQLNSAFWYELSSWDGDEISRTIYGRLGQFLTPERYRGFVQYAMWLLRPRLVREYQGWEKPRAAILRWMTPIIDAVDLVYGNPSLQLFWRNSDLVPNPSRPHPYQTDIPHEYSGLPRMFLLTSDRDPATPWKMDTEFPVMSLARVRGTIPRRTWLVYAYAPLGRQSAVRISVPEFGFVTVNVAVGGSFYLVDEATRTVFPLNPLRSRS